MLVGSATVALASVAGLAGLAAAVAPNNGPDLAGIALVITAVSGLIATVGALIVGLRRKPPDPMQTALAEAFLEQAARLRGEDPK